MKVTLTDGTSVTVHPNHEWTVYDRKRTTKKIPRTYETRQMAGTEWITPKGKRGSRARYQLPAVEAVQFATRPTQVDPYTFGYWLGNGTTSKSQVITFNPATYEEVLAHIPYAPTRIWWHKTTGVPTILFNGIPKNHTKKKTIPEEYIFNSEDVRRELLAGLIDSDGCIDKKTGRVTFSNTNKDIVDMLEIIVRSLGYNPNKSYELPKTSTSGIVGRKTVHRLDFVVHDGKKVSKIKQKNIPKPAQKRLRAIAKIETVPGGPGNCIQVDSPDGMYLVTKFFIPTHNSQLSSIYFPAWALGKYPHLQFILSTYAADLAEKFGLKARDVISAESYQSIFEGVELRKDQKAKAKWMTNKGGSYTAVGTGGSITGSGGNVILIDDPVKDRAEAESKTVSEAVWEYYRSTLYTRLEGAGAIIIIMQRWNQHDLVARVLEESKKNRLAGQPYDEWEVISLPAIAETDEHVDGRLTRTQGQPLWPSKFPVEVLENIRTTLGSYHWASQYMQDPIHSENQEFKGEMFRYYEEADLQGKYLRYYTLVDLAISQRQEADNTVVLTIAKEASGPNWYRVREDAGHYTPQQTLDLVFKHQGEYNSEVGIETVAYQKAFKYSVQEEQRKRERYFTVHEINSRTNKEVRIRGLLPLYETGVIHHRRTDVEYERELLAFPRGRRDDRIDAMANALEIVKNTGGTRAKVYKPKYTGYGRRVV